MYLRFSCSLSNSTAQQAACSVTGTQLIFNRLSRRYYGHTARVWP